MNDLAAVVCCGNWSQRVTLKPARANTMAQARPIRPAPMTATFVMVAPFYIRAACASPALVVSSAGRNAGGGGDEQQGAGGCVGRLARRGAGSGRLVTAAGAGGRGFLSGRFRRCG